ncbi:unnamed protein product [Pneumocystis jirovecii]|uniref:Uncharacterized protein n=1 Tax=Pneumocystis jirovecii TaxID=42068 RepID=L0PC21_PNEJI|nr:unnamed protein product [Pneumocystis jirovecii]
MSRAITFSTFLLIPASTLLLLCCLSVPITRLVSLGSLSDLRFVQYNWDIIWAIDIYIMCNGSEIQDCYAAISLKPKYTSDFYFSFYKTPKLSNALILHVGPSKSGFFLVIVLIVSLLAILASLLSFVIDVLFFIPHLDWGSWGVLAALILNTLVFGLVHLARKHLAVSQTEKIKTAFSYHSQRCPESTFVYKSFPPPRHPNIPVKKKKNEKERIDKNKSNLDSVKHSNNDTTTYTSNLKKLELPPINIHFDDHHKMSSINFLDPAYCNLESHSDSHFSGQCSNINNKDKHKDNDGVYNSHSRRDDVSRERTISSDEHSKEHSKYRSRDPREHIREHRNPREYMRDPRESTRDPRECPRDPRDPRSHIRYYSTDMPRDFSRDPSRDRLRNYPRYHSRYHSTDIPRHHPREHSVDISREPLRDSREPAKEFSREHPREYPRQYPKEFIREYPREFQKEHLKEHVNGHSREHSKDHSKEHSVSQTRSQQNSNHRVAQYPPSKPLCHGVEPEGDSKPLYDSVEKGKPCDNFNNLYDEYVPPRQSWKNYPLSQNGYTFSEGSVEGQPGSSSNYKAWVVDKSCENNFQVHNYVSQNHAYAPRSYQSANYRFPDNVERLQSSNDHGRIHQNYRSNNCLRRQGSPSRLRSPAESTSSHFTSISQRGINPNWVPPSKEQPWPINRIMGFPEIHIRIWALSEVLVLVEKNVRI